MLARSSTRAGPNITILPGIEDVTAQRILEREKDELLKDKDVLFEELQHRVSNSLQIIASILLMKARVVKSEETRFHLQDAHKRVLSVAAVQNSSTRRERPGRQRLRLTSQNYAKALRPR